MVPIKENLMYGGKSMKKSSSPGNVKCRGCSPDAGKARQGKTGSSPDAGRGRKR